MILQINEAIFINRHLRPKEAAQGITVERIEDEILFGYNDGAVNLFLTLDQLRAIMRFFDVPQEEQS